MLRGGILHPRLGDWHKRRLRQVVNSIPHYLEELRDIHNAKEAVNWAYYKFPYLFKLRKFPPRVTVEFTNHCNFACGYCPRSIMTRAIGSMDAGLFESLCRQLEEGEVSELKIGGLGEPVLHPDFARMMTMLDRSRMKVLLYTNGSLFNRFAPEEICRWNTHTIVLSVDGLDAISFERQRKGGNYAEIRNGAAKFHEFRSERKPVLEIRHVNMPDETGADLRAFRRDWLTIADTVKFNYLIPLRPSGANVPSRVRCRDIRREVYVRWDGRLLLCAGQSRQRPQEWLGDANQTPVSELWFDVRLEDLRSAHVRRDGKLPDCCQHCAFR